MSALIKALSTGDATTLFMVLLFLGVIVNLPIVVRFFLPKLFIIQTPEQRLVEKKIEGALESLKSMANIVESQEVSTKEIKYNIKDTKQDVSQLERKLVVLESKQGTNIEEIQLLRKNVQTLLSGK